MPVTQMPGCTSYSMYVFTEIRLKLEPSYDPIYLYAHYMGRTLSPLVLLKPQFGLGVRDSGCASATWTASGRDATLTRSVPLSHNAKRVGAGRVPDDEALLFSPFLSHHPPHQLPLFPFPSLVPVPKIHNEHARGV